MRGPHHNGHYDHEAADRQAGPAFSSTEIVMMLSDMRSQAFTDHLPSILTLIITRHHS